MYGSRAKVWAVFTGWLLGAVLCGVLDHSRQSTLFLPVFLASSVVAVLVATRKYRRRDYEYQLVLPGVVRSPFGFEVRALPFRLEYVEGDHMISWHASPINTSTGRFNLSESGITGWDNPFQGESMDADNKREVMRAVASALLYLQLVDAGKIQPKNVRHGGCGRGTPPSGAVPQGPGAGGGVAH